MIEEPRTVECFFCGWKGREFLPAGRRLRPNRRCPGCGSLERHRLIARGLDACFRSAPGAAAMDIGPQDCLALLAHRHPSIRFFTLDLERRADVRGDIQRLPLGDRCIDVLVCLHVLEHVQADMLALRELHRTLSPRGLLLLQVPESGSRCIDGRNWPPSERERVLGHRQHLRSYAPDSMDERLRSAGFCATRWPLPGDLSSAQARRSGIRPGQTLHLCSRSDSAVTTLELAFRAGGRR